MREAIVRWRDEVGETYVLGAVRVMFGLLLVANALRAASQLAHRDSSVGVFRWPILPDWLLASPGGLEAIVIAQALLAVLVIAGYGARAALLGSAVAGTYVLLCDRLQFHHNRWALFCFSFLLAFAPCDRSHRVRRSAPTSRGPLWACRLAQVQLSIIYLASGGSKLLDADWRGGRVILERFLLFGREAIDRGVPAQLVEWFSHAAVTSVLAKLAIGTEIFLAFGLWSRRTRVFALWWGAWFHLTIEATSRVESFTWLTLAIYALFATPGLRERTLLYDGSRMRGRALARLVRLLDWLARFEVKPWAPDGMKTGHAIVVVRRDGSHATGMSALAMLTRCTPVLFPLWGPIALLASFTRRGDVGPRA